MRAFMGIVILFFATATSLPYGCAFGFALILWGIHDRISELKK